MIDCVISSIAAPVSLTDAVSASVSRLTDFDRAGHLGDRRGDLLRRRRHLLRRAGDGWIDAALSWIAAPVSAIEAARLVVFAVTCSIDAAISLTDDPSSSAEAATDSAWPAVSFSDAAISVMPPSGAVERAHLRVRALRDLVGDARDRAGGRQ